MRIIFGMEPTSEYTALVVYGVIVLVALHVAALVSFLVSDYICKLTTVEIFDFTWSNMTLF